MILTCFRRGIGSLIFLGLAGVATAAELPTTKNEPVKSQPTAILFLSWQPALDKTYADKLAARGYVATKANSMDPLAPDFLKQFNVFVLDEVPDISYEDNKPDRMANYHNNMRVIKQAVEAGAGLLTYTAGGGGWVAGWNQEMKSYGIAALHRGVYDASVGGTAPWKGYVETSYGWTKNLSTNSPVTTGLQRIYYPMGELNGTGVFPTMPLVCDTNWTPLVKTMAGARLTLFNPPGVALVFEPTPPQTYPICAVRNVGKGRVSALTIAPEFTHRYGYGDRQVWFEENLGNLDGTLLEKGDGVVKSDAGEFLFRLYAWLAGDSAQAGFGGYVAGTPVVKLASEPPPPLTNAPPLQQFKALIGVRSKISNGTGTVAECARAARQAGYSLLAFTETFAQLDQKMWDDYVAQCEASSDETLTVLPGFEIQDVEGSHFLFIAPPFYPHPSWLTDDGKRLINPYTLNFYYYKHLIVLHRPESSAMPTERLKHFQGLSVYTYRDNKLVDNSLGAFTWEVQSASFPIPIVVHEIYSPGEIAEAVHTGFQQYMPEAPTAAVAVNKFCRQGINNLSHPMISGGPSIAPLLVVGTNDPNARLENKAEKTFQLDVHVTSETPLKTVTLYNGYTPVRRWLTTGKEFQAAPNFPFSHQYGFWVLAEDSAGHQAIRSMFWVAPALWPGVFRCTDRQNWLGHLAMYYTGAFLPFGGAYDSLRMPIKGTDESNGLFHQIPGTSMAEKMSIPFTGNDVAITDFILEDKYVEATFAQVGLSMLPSRASKPSSVYSGRVRYYCFTQSTLGEPWVGLIDYDLTLKRAVEPLDPAGLFPMIAATHGTVFCAWDGTKFTTNATTKEHSPLVAMPRGSLGGGIIPLDDGFAMLNGHFGRILPGTPDYLPAGTRLTGRYLVAGRSNSVGSYDKVTKNFETAPPTWLKAMGFAGETPYQLVLTRGKLGSIGFLAPITPEQNGVAGEVQRKAEIPYQLPLQITGLNPRWVAGSWRDGAPIQYTGVFEQTAWPRLDVSRTGKFFAGNLLTADNPNLVLAIAKWDAEAICAEVHNPTSAPITATVSTPAEITGYKACKQTITVAAGSTVFAGD